MCNKKNEHIIALPKKFLVSIIFFLISFAAVVSASVQNVDTIVSSKHYTVDRYTLTNGAALDQITINGPPKPPPGFDVQRQAVSLPQPNIAQGVNFLTVPAFDWVFGCSAVSGAMIAGYYDRTGWPNIYTGPTNGGIMPLNNSSWPTWTDGSDTYPSCPLIASMSGVDGAVGGSIDDYWTQYGSCTNDPYITGSWTQHNWGTSIGDYMKTSQTAFENCDGSTQFWNYSSSATPLTCSDMESHQLSNLDGTYGRKLFYEARGYTVTDCYNQSTDNTIAGGFSFAQFMAEINAGRPVLLNLAGHSVVGVGYDSASNLVYIHDTWDYNNHTMTWGGSYGGMSLISVSIVNLQANDAADTAKLYSTFDGRGTFQWNGTAWKKIRNTAPTCMATSGTDLYAGFAGSGLFKWNGTSWSKLSKNNPVNMVVSGTNLYVGFSELVGLFRWNGTSWKKLRNKDPVGMVVSGSDLYASFTELGLLKWNGTSWEKVSKLIPVDMIVPGNN
jgi:YD repeat-containing protein